LGISADEGIVLLSSRRSPRMLNLPSVQRSLIRRTGPADKRVYSADASSIATGSPS
jgi:hypothetical protein